MQSRSLFLLTKVYNWLRCAKGRVVFLVQLLGLVGWIQYELQQLRLRYFKVRGPYTLRSKYARFKLLSRPNTSDIEVFHQVFLERQYRCLDSVEEPELVLDCGANVGYSAAYFLTRFPQAKLIAVEPDPANCAILEANLAPFAGKYRVVRSAIWPQETGLVWDEQCFGNCREFSLSVRPVRPGEAPLIAATTIGFLLQESGANRISILKIDIEKSELAVFSTGYKDWLDRVDNLVIELHGDECAAVFYNAISDQGFTVSQLGELTVCRRVSSRDD